MRPITLLFVPFLAATGCHNDASGPSTVGTSALADAGPVLAAAEDEAPVASAAAQRGKLATAAAQRIDIPAGAFIAGSTPGDRGRDPVLEPALLGVELGSFQIDRYLYPNDPKRPILLGVSRTKAGELCQDAGGRLCTELEWERACKGPSGDMFAGGSTWDASCASTPSSCASGFDVLGMGTAYREWTASDVAAIEKMSPKSAAVRGARSDAAGPDHRCAHRLGVDASASADDLGFRCCYGAPNAKTIPSPEWQQTYRRAELPIAELSTIVGAVPSLAPYANELAYFGEDSASRTVLSRGDAGAAPDNVTLTTAPILWSPVPGEELLVIAAQSGKNSVIAAFHKLPDGRYRVASTLLLRGERGPLVLGFNGYVRKRLSWAICWDCPSESGNVTYRDDNRVVITQK